MRVEPYQEFLAEREELLRHKWLMSEKKGKDIGFERALVDWAKRHRSDWRQKRNLALNVEAGQSRSNGKG